MELFPYKIKLIDPLFYSNEALSGALTPPYLHATAINHAVAWCMGRIREDQSYIISEQKGGRNIPRYENSWIEPDFYFTPASIIGDTNYQVEIVKGDMDYLIQPGFGLAKINNINIGRNEVLKAYRIFTIPPETEFNGYLYAVEDIINNIPKYIRLGSFRGKAILQVDEKIKSYGIVSNQYVNHPVDPLVSKVKRGVMICMFPYPIIDSALVESCYEIRNHNQKEYIAVPTQRVNYNKDELLSRIKELKPGLLKIKDYSISLKDRSYIILYMLRTAISIKYLLVGISSEERLNAVLNEIDGIENIRMASKGESINIDETILNGFYEKIVELINESEKKITGEEESKSSWNSGKSSSSIVL